MFGTYRTLLALMVVGQHIGGIPLVGSYAVFGFYALSGYLMTFIMQNNYGYSRQGVGKYAINRFLRIYPIYWVSIGLSALLVLVVGEDVASAYHGDIRLPQTPGSLLRNLLLFFPFMESPRLTPPAWALTVELCFYTLIGLGLSRTRRSVWIWFALSAAYHGVALYFDWDFYFSVFAASLPFATGALIFHYRSELNAFLARTAAGRSHWLPVAAFTMMLVNWGVGHLMPELEKPWFYFNYLLCSSMVAILSDRKSLPVVSSRLDRWFGDLSYPIYLLHCQVGLVVMVAVNAAGLDLPHPGPALMAISLPFILAASWFVSVSIEAPIERMRSRVKNGLGLVVQGASVEKR
jgi:peptidoglycan/LPS O-acetylase OafA/YrhL